MTHSAVLLLLDCLAVFRLTHLVTVDRIAAPLRDLAIGHTYEGAPRNLDGSRMALAKRPRVAQLLGCPWCVSFWLAFPVVALQALAGWLWIYAACVLAFSAVAGLLSERA